MSDTLRSPPLYRSIANDLRQLIWSGELPPGAKVPAERQLVEET
jgi:DNA-binding GntR family transcriptional regulator